MSQRLFSPRDGQPVSPPTATGGESPSNDTAVNGSAGSTTPDNNAQGISSDPKTNSKILKDERDRILALPFRSSHKATEEVVDIVNDYPWILENPNKSKGVEINISSNRSRSTNESNSGAGIMGQYTKIGKIPVCYMVERKNAVNGSITAILGMLSMLEQIGDNVIKVGNDIGNAVSRNLSEGAGSAIKAIGNFGGSFINGVKDVFATVMGSVFQKLGPLEAQNNLNDEILNPYRYLYFTADTKKRFVFPLLSDQSCLFTSSKLNWKDVKIQLPGAVGKFFKGAMETLEQTARFSTMMANISSLTDSANGDTDDAGYVSEAAKSFEYPKTGDSLKIQFTLYNTTRKNAWKDNYRFLYLFAVRNLPFRLEMFSFVPPLLYDIVVPGIKRMPISALNQMQVKPVGMIRTLECDNFIAKSDTANKIQVAVPEAWDVTLTFQSLIAPSANLLLCNMVSELGITASSMGGIGKITDAEKSAMMEQLDNDGFKLSDACEKIKRNTEIREAQKQMEICEGVGAGIELMHYFNTNLKDNPNKSYEMALQTFGKTNQIIKDENGNLTMESKIAAIKVMQDNGYLKIPEDPLIYIPDDYDANDPNTYGETIWTENEKDLFVTRLGVADTAGTTPTALDAKQRAYLIAEKYNGDSDKAYKTFRFSAASASYSDMGTGLPNYIGDKHNNANRKLSTYRGPDGEQISIDKMPALKDYNSFKTYEAYMGEKGRPDDYLTDQELENLSRDIDRYRTLDAQSKVPSACEEQISKLKVEKTK